jgi:hypothetical protein
MFGFKHCKDSEREIQKGRGREKERLGRKKEKRERKR